MLDLILIFVIIYAIYSAISIIVKIVFFLFKPLIPNPPETKRSETKRPDTNSYFSDEERKQRGLKWRKIVQKKRLKEEKQRLKEEKQRLEKEEQQRIEKEATDNLAKKIKELAENLEITAYSRLGSIDHLQEELARLKSICFLRDSEHQSKPYTYQIGKHGNESLAIRYGIDNKEKSGSPSNTIEIKKIRKISKDLYKNNPRRENMYLVELVDFKRKAIAVHEVGENYIKTFYPMNESWFEEQSHLDSLLKNNGTFTLKELATFHVKAIINQANK